MVCRLPFTIQLQLVSHSAVIQLVSLKHFKCDFLVVANLRKTGAWLTKLTEAVRPGACFSKVPKCFSTLKTVVKSQTS